MDAPISILLSSSLARAGRVLAFGLSLAAGTALAPAAHGASPNVAAGTLAAMPAGSNADAIDVPDAKVTLVNGANVVVASGVTHIDGSFRLRAPAPGLYSLCWDIQGRRGCRREIPINAGINSLRRVQAPVEGPVVLGRVLNGDGRACWLNDPFFNLNVATRMGVLDAGGRAVIGPQRANTRGYYVIPLPTFGAFTLTAQCERAAVKAPVSISGATTVNLKLPNRAPRLRELAARQGSRAVVQVVPSSAYVLSADGHDADGDGIEYLWRENDGSGTVAGVNPTLNLLAPTTPGRHSRYVIARDGKGGYAYKRIDLEVAAPRITVSGIAIDEVTRAPVPKATVELAGVKTTTSARGWFSVKVVPNVDNRYVLNIHHPKYALMSRVYDRSSTGNTYELIGAQLTVHPAGSAIDVLDTSSAGPCGGKSRIGASPLRTVEYIDPGQENQQRLDPALISKLTTATDCVHQGARLRIPAGALVQQATGAAPVGDIRLSMATLDPTRRMLPGDYQAVAAGVRSELLSYGAVFAEFTDSVGNALNLRPGTKAEVRVPVPPKQRATAKPTIDFWSYDEKTGRWVPEGKGTLVGTGSAMEYVASTVHFSTLNMDVAGSDPAVSTCVRFEVGASLAAWTNLKLRATVSYNGNAVQTKETFLDGNQYHAVFRIPYGAGFPPNTLRVELFGTYSGQSVVLVDNIINTDARPKMTGTNLWPPYPYTECGTPVVLEADPIATPAYATNDATGRPYFLTGPSGIFLPPDGEAQATTYYANVAAAKPTLGDWWVANGFNAVDGSGGTRAAYLNHNDLGFGRDMNCRQTGGGKLACYVTNYGAPNQNPANADDAQARNPATRGATVAMEYDPAAGAEAVQFFVYGNSGATAGLLKFADLDGFGPKPVPHLCVVCHGGEPLLSPSGKAEYARFREFDLPTFKYSGNRSWNFGATTLSAAELNSFGTLNQFVQAASPATSPIGPLIGAWYPGGFATAPVAPTAATVPSGWSAEVTGYNGVYGPTCRTCHIARDSGSAASFLTFNSEATFGVASYAVCNLGRTMPNAVVTYKNFWADPARVLAFETLMNPPLAANTCKND